MKKKILIFSLGYYPLPIGGAEIAIKEITDRIPSDEYEFHLICNGYNSLLPEEEKVGAVLVHRIGITKKNPTIADLRKLPLHLNKALYQWQAFRKAKRLHEQHAFDAIWAMMAHSTGVPAAKFKDAFPNVKYILTLQEGDPPAYIEHKMRWFEPWFSRAFAYADVVQVISTFLGNWAKNKGHLGEPVLVPNAVHTTHFTQTFSLEELREVRRSYGVADTDTLLVTTSRLVHKNAVDDVIRALPLLPDPVKFIVFGTGPDEEMLRSLATKLGVSTRVHFMGHLDHAEMPKRLKACDIFIRPSRSEGMGNSFLEAMAAGLPVIATQVGGISDFLFDSNRDPDHQTTGWAVDPDNPNDIARAVQDILQNKDVVEMVTKTATTMVIQKYDWDIIAKRMKTEVFDHVLLKK